jgi:hypothetical protein
MPDTPAPNADTAAEDGAYLVIQGETQGGGKFRPSDWCDRLYGTLQALGDESEFYSQYIHLVNLKGKKCLLVDVSLEEINAALYGFFRRFANDNALSTYTLSKPGWQELNSSA